MFKVNNKVYTDFTPYSNVFIVNIEQVNASWVVLNLANIPPFLVANVIYYRSFTLFGILSLKPFDTTNRNILFNRNINLGNWFFM